MATKNPLRVLVVEDHKPCSRLLEIVLQRGGHVTMVTTTVEAALSALTLEQFDVLICDLLLPDGHGFEVIRTVRCRELKIFSIAVTGAGTQEIEAEALKHGFDRFIRKPFKPQVIEALLIEQQSALGDRGGIR